MVSAIADGGVRSVQIALDVLETVAFSNEELGVTQIADRLGLTKGSVHRHLHTLVDRGYLTQNPATTRYSVGPKSRLLARYAPEDDLVRIADGPMRELRDKIGQSVVLSAMTSRGALVISALPSSSPIEIGVRPGSELAFHSSAQGKVLLAFAQYPFQKRILTQSLQAFTAKTIVAADRLEAELAQTRRIGFASAPEEAMLGVNAVAAPVFDQTDAAVAAVAIVGSIQFLPANPEERVITTLKNCADQISRKLGHSRMVTI
jgi:IclR family transcriptional regulator, KDG regulon repressor